MHFENFKCGNVSINFVLVITFALWVLIHMPQSDIINLIQKHIGLLLCPIKKEQLSLINKSELSEEEADRAATPDCEYFLINKSKSFVYRIVDEIILLLPKYGIPLQDEVHKGDQMHFDKDRVFRYYNEIEYSPMEDKSIYGDSDKFVDFRDVVQGYFRRSLSKASEHINSTGTYFLDAGCGPIGLKEYLDLSLSYDLRICFDLSFEALKQAKNNISDQDALFVCGDMTNIPLSSNSCDTVVSHHALYHIPKKEQRDAMCELYRVTMPTGTMAVVYNWFYHSWMMNITLFPVQIYRILRHIAGKLYVKYIDSDKPRLYFYAHSPQWFRQLPFGGKIQFFCWRSINKYFMNIYIHKHLFGRRVLNIIEKFENRFPKTMGLLGDYPIIIVKK